LGLTTIPILAFSSVYIDSLDFIIIYEKLDFEIVLRLLKTIFLKDYKVL